MNGSTPPCRSVGLRRPIYRETRSLHPPAVGRLCSQDGAGGWRACCGASCRGDPPATIRYSYSVLRIALGRSTTRRVLRKSSPSLTLHRRHSASYGRSTRAGGTGPPRHPWGSPGGALHHRSRHGTPAARAPGSAVVGSRPRPRRAGVPTRSSAAPAHWRNRKRSGQGAPAGPRSRCAPLSPPQGTPGGNPLSGLVFTTEKGNALGPSGDPYLERHRAGWASPISGSTTCTRVATL